MRSTADTLEMRKDVAVSRDVSPGHVTQCTADQAVREIITHAHILAIMCVLSTRHRRIWGSSRYVRYVATGQVVRSHRAGGAALPLLLQTPH